MFRNHTPVSFPSRSKPVKSSLFVNEPEEPSLAFSEASTTDTDGDGFFDLVEIQAGTNQNDSASFPVSLFNVFNGV